MGNETTHVANACNGELQIYFQSDKLHIQEIAHEVTTHSGLDITNTVEAFLEGGNAVNVLLRPDTRVEYARCAPKEFISIPAQGDLYVTITCNRGPKEELMCYNLYIPSNRSIIVTNNGLVKFAKRGDIWKDETGEQW